VLVIGALFVTSDHAHNVSFFWDGDGIYVKRRALAVSQMWAGVPVGPVELWHALHRPYGWSSYIWVLAYVQYLLGAAPYGVHLVAVALFVAAAVLLYRIVRPIYGSAPALLGLTVTLFLPTLISWSVSALKESLYLFLAAVAVSAAIVAARGQRLWRRLAAAAVSIGAIASLGTVRVNADLLMAGAIVASIATAWLIRSKRFALAGAVLVPLVIVALSYDVGARSMTLTAARRAAATHLDYVRSGGHSYHLLDERFYAEPLPAPMTGAEAWRFTGRALISVAIVPLPWQIVSRTELAFLPQQVIWYVLAGLAVLGLVVGLRRDPLITCMFATVAVVNGAAIAVTNGNIGTMVRLRDMIVPFTTWLSALGAVTTLSWCMTMVTARAPKQVDSPGRVIDARGRLFGRVNLIDAAIVIVLLVLVPLAYGAFLLFREPTPAIASITPAHIVANAGARVTVAGDHFRAHLDARIGDVTATFHPQTTTEAELDLPALPPGTYDLALVERGAELVRKPAALTVVAPSPKMAVVTARVIAFPELLPQLKSGDVDVERSSDDASVRATLVSIGQDRQPTRAIMSTPAGAPREERSPERSSPEPEAQVEQNVMSFTATFRVPVVSMSSGWSYHDRPVKIGAPIRFETMRGILRGWIVDVEGPSE